jgi:hypothetical protein
VLKLYNCQFLRDFILFFPRPFYSIHHAELFFFFETHHDELALGDWE